jgi:Predicted Zn-dependent protease
MEIIIQDTLNLYRALLNLPGEQRSNYFRDVLMKPHAPAFSRMQMPISPEALGCMPMEGRDSEINEMLIKLENFGVWENARKTLNTAAEQMQSAGIALPEKVILGIFLGEPSVLTQSRGYTGMGSIPGYIQILIAPDEYNLPRINACIAHEFHHNIYFYNARWNFLEVTLGKYLAVEGLAESFATSIFGKESAGPWVTDITNEELLRSRAVISRNLSVSGFLEVRKYMYGDHPMVPEGKELGVAYCGGYAVGYHAVQAYLEKTGSSVLEASKLDGDELMRLSGYFDHSF